MEPEDGIVNVAMQCSSEGWKTSKAAWFDLELADEGEIFFVDMVFLIGRRGQLAK
jgi:hypothetical protein